ncbi:N-acetyl-D-Glu racemase DgcA [Glacieibacterium frigidum]|uniref:Dipeptide epimerase n=1 Tax=Glacieibacterium frigidum TaxID=2593303 RepID=A0A552UH53_9SPHN|nr:N-acetyl-D-Glu racemase DgcA [Glacieibacterium frigidum]TRW17507.1 dipeptide epimerase [Glacieibacterium frigidum]
MSRILTARIERFAVRGAFVIARGAKTHVDVVVAEVADGAHTGRGEGTPIYYRGDDVEQALAAIEAQRDAVAGGATRADLLTTMPSGAARNALDAALWDLEAKISGAAVWQTLGLPKPQPMLTAYTISLGEPGAMEAAARAAKGRELLKLKISGEGDVERVAAVRRGAPDARLIVDANEAWGAQDIERLAHALDAHRVELIEQPVPAGQDHLLDHVRSPIPLCADESCHDRSNLGSLIGRYRFINIKLDKAGGLTEAWALASAAKQRGLGLMTGCMLSTSLGIAPAFPVAMLSQFADLDGPLLIEDRAGGMRFEGSDVWPPERELWG